jgi:RNA-directed DNA polymerase
VISPLLLNIALHGLEAALGVRHNNRGETISPRAVVRYADDLVVFCESQADAEAVVHTLTTWLAQRGLRLSPTKTRIVHLTTGFDFLGFHIRHYPALRTRKAGYKLLITPSKPAVKRLRMKLRAAWQRLQGANAPAVVKHLNPLIRGWANYYRKVVASNTFRKLDAWMYYRADRYVRRSHPNKSARWRIQRYWGQWNRQRADRWVFGDSRSGMHLLKFSWFPIRYHIQVRGTASPDDPTLRTYWAQREKAQAADLPPGHRKLAQAQQYRCRLCGESLFNEEAIQVHHIIPRSKGGGNHYANLTLVHLYCQQQIHSGKIEPTDATGEPLLL